MGRESNHTNAAPLSKAAKAFANFFYFAGGFVSSLGSWPAAPQNFSNCLRNSFLDWCAFPSNSLGCCIFCKNFIWSMLPNGPNMSSNESALSSDKSESLPRGLSGIVVPKWSSQYPSFSGKFGSVGPGMYVSDKFGSDLQCLESSAGLFCSVPGEYSVFGSDCPVNNFWSIPSATRLVVPHISKWFYQLTFHE